MNIISQNSAALSQEQHLVPAADLLDGRTELDTLNFLTQFASLINFYDKTNKVKGNWAPFLLKDPVFLLASISKSGFNRPHSIYRNICLRIDKIISTGKRKEDLGLSFNLLFNQVDELFFRIGNWNEYMEKTGEQYELQHYITSQLSEKFSAVFWALHALRENMFLTPVIPGIEPPAFAQPEWLKEDTWTDNKDKMPYWQILGLQHPLEYNTPENLLEAIETAGDELFVFFQTILQHAASEYESVKQKKSKYPDTTLLRTFASLLNIYRDELNGLSAKHLQFYYQDILRQYQELAQPDKVFVDISLGKPDSVFYLSKGTALNAGLDEDKKTIVFETLHDAVINTAEIVKSYTLNKIENADKRFLFYLDKIENPGEVVRNEMGKIISWKTFGSSDQAVRKNMGISIASPMFCLREGKRYINIELGFEEINDMRLLQKETQYFFSTADTWLQVYPKISYTSSGNAAVFNLAIVLDHEQPAIEAFVQNPDGYQSEWPLLRMEFGSLADTAQPPLLRHMKIDVTASGMQTFQLYNDFGGLDPKTPFPLFGPTPVVNNSFIVGNAEIFSKPFTALDIKIEWDTLPGNFLDYYKEYNNYFNHNKKSPGEEKKNKENTIAPAPPAEQKGKNLLKRILDLIKAILKFIFRRKNDPQPVPINTPVYTNSCFTVEFNLLDNRSWRPFDMKKVLDCDVSSGGVVHCKPFPLRFCPIPVDMKGEMLFDLKQDCELGPSSRFAYILPPGEQNTYVPDPTLQKTPLQFTDTSTAGFMRMDLAGPEYGFGTPIYGNVINYVALENARIIAALVKDPDKKISFLPAANIPFVPQVKTFAGTYSASYTYTFDYSKGQYPVQCYSYAPFETYLVYDNSRDVSAYSDHVGIGITGSREVRDGLPLFPFFKYNGALFLQMQDVVPANPLNIYAELAPAYGEKSSSSPDWFYLGRNGWKDLQVLSDSTSDFSCSGIVRVNVPEEITQDSFVMPGTQYWLSAAVNNDPGDYAETFYLKTNGVIAQRTGTDFLTRSVTPHIDSNAIEKPLQAIPEIAAIQQPFPSFGGRGAESKADMNRRVSNRIRTKNRVASRSDYFSAIRQEFADIFYSKTIFDPLANVINTYLVPVCLSQSDPNAFNPVVSICQQEKVQSFLVGKSAVFAGQHVSGFDFLYVQATVLFTMTIGYEFFGMKQIITDRLNVFMSPWIKSDQVQLDIDTGLTSAQVAAYLQTIPGVSKIDNVTFKTYTKDRSGKKHIINTGVQLIQPSVANMLIVPDTHPVIELAA